MEEYAQLLVLVKRERKAQEELDLQYAIQLYDEDALARGYSIKTDEAVARRLQNQWDQEKALEREEMLKFDLTIAQLVLQEEQLLIRLQEQQISKDDAATEKIIHQLWLADALEQESEMKKIEEDWNMAYRMTTELELSNYRQMALDKKAQENACYVCLESDKSVLLLKCGHNIHVTCAKNSINAAKTQPGSQINFNVGRCGQCKKWMENQLLDKEVAPFKMLYDQVSKIALVQHKEQYMPKAIPGRHNPLNLDIDANQILKDYIYYMCFKCSRPFCGGKHQCEDEFDRSQNVTEISPKRLCAKCGDLWQQAVICGKPTHLNYYEYKCRYCCKLATYFCHGTTHYCNSCHQHLPRKPIRCPGKPHCNGQHPPNDGQEHSLGCSLCRNAAVL